MNLGEKPGGLRTAREVVERCKRNGRLGSPAEVDDTTLQGSSYCQLCDSDSPLVVHRHGEVGGQVDPL